MVDVRINGHNVSESTTDGYQVRRGPGTIVQYNIPPSKVGDLYIVTREYKTEKPHYQGFRPEDWTVAQSENGQQNPDSPQK